MQPNKHLIFGVNVSGIKHPLRLKWYGDDVVGLVNAIDMWLPVMVARVSNGRGCIESVSREFWANNAVHVAYWYDDNMYYYAEVTENVADMFIPSPAIASIYSELDTAPVAYVSQAQAFNSLWEAVKEKQAIAEAQMDMAQRLAMAQQQERERQRNRYRRG